MRGGLGGGGAGEDDGGGGGGEGLQKSHALHLQRLQFSAGSFWHHEWQPSTYSSVVVKQGAVGGDGGFGGSFAGGGGGGEGGGSGE